MRVRQLHFGPDQEFEPGRVVAALALRGPAATPTPQKSPQSGTPHAAAADSRTTPLPPHERPVYNTTRPSPTALREQNPVPNPPSPTAHWLTTAPPLRQQVAAGEGAVILNAGRAGTPGGPAAHAKSPGHCLREALQGGTEAVAVLVSDWGLNRLRVDDKSAIVHDHLQQCPQSSMGEGPSMMRTVEQHFARRIGRSRGWQCVQVPRPGAWKRSAWGVALLSESSFSTGSLPSAVLARGTMYATRSPRRTTLLCNP